MEHLKGSGDLPFGKNWTTSAKQWWRVCANKRQKLGVLVLESDIREKSNKRTKPMPSNSRVYRSRASWSSNGNCAGVAGGNENEVAMFLSTRCFMVAKVNKMCTQLPNRHSKSARATASQIKDR